MMFPFRRRTTPKPATSKDKLPLPADRPPNVTELHLQHLDYNGQPLNVEGLSHYIEPMVENERFRVH
jgi:hypothetical protein